MVDSLETAVEGAPRVRLGVPLGVDAGSAAATESTRRSEGFLRGLVWRERIAVLRRPGTVSYSGKRWLLHNKV